LQRNKDDEKPLTKVAEKAEKVEEKKKKKTPGVLFIPKVRQFFVSG
jgi:hypothetical protein